MFNDRSSPVTLLATRRSGKPRDMVAPGPDDGELQRILETAMRVPDHGKLAPWRFVIIGSGQREAFADLIIGAFREENPDAGPLELDPLRQFATQAPTLVAVISSPVPHPKIPAWEQQLSAGAACMNLLTATHAAGFVGGWLTGWATYSRKVADSLGAGPDDRIAGFIFIGSPSRELEERPRPAYEAVVSSWKG